MCEKCVPIHPSMVEQVTAKARAAIKDLILRIEKLQGLADDIEDRYRQSGLAYHSTQAEARDEFNNDPDLQLHLVRCEEAFELTTVEEYKTLFKPLHSVVQRLSDLRSQAQHVPSVATAAELMHQVHCGFPPKMGELITEFEKIQEQFNQLHRDSGILLDASKWAFSTDEQGNRVVWHDTRLAAPYCTGSNVWRRRTLLREGCEYQFFCDWLLSLPETARAIQTGTCLEDIALGMLWEGVDEFLPSRN